MVIRGGEVSYLALTKMFQGHNIPLNIFKPLLHHLALCWLFSILLVAMENVWSFLEFRSCD